jgi:hypothetical protein
MHVICWYSKRLFTWLACAQAQLMDYQCFSTPAAAILQDREVTVYRLVSKATYEQQLFECASRKYGLDEAILGFGGGERSSSRAQASHAAAWAQLIIIIWVVLGQTGWGALTYLAVLPITMCSRLLNHALVSVLSAQACL